MIIPTIKFVFDRKHLASRDEKGKIDLRITFNRKQKFMATGIQCLPSQWDAKHECVKTGSTLEAKELNAILLKIRKRVMTIIGNMVDIQEVDLNAIPALLKQESVDITFEDYIIMRMRKKDVTEHTYRCYVSMLNKMKEFGRFKFFSDITQKNIRDFGEWLHAYERTVNDKYGRKRKARYSQATIYKITSNLSLFISDAVVDGYVKENPYVTKKMNESKGNTRIDQYLTADELERLERSEMPTASLNEARNLFLLQCYTGLSYIDLVTYDFTKHKRGGDMELCSGKRHKTGVEYHFMLTSKARNVLKQLGYHVPKIPNQKYNVKLKLVADAAGVDKNITSHMGRRTAGSVWLNSGIPIEVVSKCLGHSSIAMTQRAYAKILDTTIIDAFKKLNK